MSEALDLALEGKGSDEGGVVSDEGRVKRGVRGKTNRKKTK
jgi:hypothetical protein